jgi:hypothetical protein
MYAYLYRSISFQRINLKCVRQQRALHLSADVLLDGGEKRCFPYG